MKHLRFLAFFGFLAALVASSFGCGSETGNTGGTGGASCDLAACPPASNECVEVACNPGGTCDETPKPDGTPTATQTAGDCKQTVCQAGAPVVQDDDTDLPDDGNECTAGACEGGVPTHAVWPAEAPCGARGLSF